MESIDDTFNESFIGVHILFMQFMVSIKCFGSPNDKMCVMGVNIASVMCGLEVFFVVDFLS